MADVPNIDYQELTLNMVKEYMQLAINPKIKAVFDDPELKEMVLLRWFTFGCASAELPLKRGHVFPHNMMNKIDEYKFASTEQMNKRHQLQQNLLAVADSCTTRKALVAALPEFEKYLPADEQAACKTLPAIANVLSDFVKAGWPKDQKKIPRTDGKITI